MTPIERKQMLRDLRAEIRTAKSSLRDATQIETAAVRIVKRRVRELAELEGELKREVGR